MLLTKLLDLVHKSPDSFKDWGCGIKCLKGPSYCEEN